MSNQHRIHRNNYEDHFTIFSNKQWEYDFLSWGAKGLLGYILSRPKDWIIYRSQLSSIYKGEKRGNGKDAIDAMFEELIEYGFIIYTAKDEKTGQFIHRYDVYPEPKTELKNKVPKVVKPCMALSSSGLNHPQTSNNCNQEMKRDNNTAVVVFSCLDDLKITSTKKQQLSERMNEEDCKRLVSRVKAWKEKKNDLHGVNTILKNWADWSDEVTKVDIEAANKEFLDSTPFKDGLEINNHRIIIGRKTNCEYIEFVCGMFLKQFNTNQKNFIKELKGFSKNRLKLEL